VYKGGPKLSMSKRRSSAVGYKARLADARKSHSLSMTALNSNNSALSEHVQVRICVISFLNNLTINLLGHSYHTSSFSHVLFVFMGVEPATSHIICYKQTIYDFFYYLVDLDDSMMRYIYMPN